MSTLDLLRKLLHADSLLCIIAVEPISGSFYQVTVEWPYTNETPTVELRLPKHVFATRVVTIPGNKQQFNRQDLRIVVNDRFFQDEYAPKAAVAQ